MNLRTHRELDSLIIEPVGAGRAPAARISSARAVTVKSLVKVIVISIINMILLNGNSG